MKYVLSTVYMGKGTNYYCLNLFLWQEVVIAAVFEAHCYSTYTAVTTNVRLSLLAERLTFVTMVHTNQCKGQP